MHERRLGAAVAGVVPVLAAAGALALAGDTARAASPQATGGATLAGRPVVLDGSGKLLSWVDPQDHAYATVVRLAWEQLLTGFPVEENGLPTWLAYCCFDDCLPDLSRPAPLTQSLA